MLFMYCTTFIVYSVFWFLTLKRSKIYIFYIKKIVILNTMFIYFLFLKSFWLLFFFFFLLPPCSFWWSRREAPPQESWKASRPQRWKGQPTEGRKKSLLRLRNFLSAYSDITNSSARACVRERVCRPERTRGGERERQRERRRASEQAKGEALYSFTYPPSNHRREGPSPDCQSNPLVAAGIISATNYWQITCQGV